MRTKHILVHYMIMFLSSIYNSLQVFNQGTVSTLASIISAHFHKHGGCKCCHQCLHPPSKFQQSGEYWQNTNSIFYTPPEEEIDSHKFVKTE